MRKQGIDGTGMLNLYDRVTGIFNEIFDARLLTAAIFALVGYCTLFMQQKFPMRWMIFVLFGMILLIVVACVAVYGIALYHGTPHGNDYIEMENGNAS